MSPSQISFNLYFSSKPKNAQAATFYSHMITFCKRKLEDLSTCFSEPKLDGDGRGVAMRLESQQGYESTQCFTKNVTCTTIILLNRNYAQRIQVQLQDVLLKEDS